MPRIPDDMTSYGGGPSLQPRRGVVQGPADGRIDAIADLGETIGKIGQGIQDREDKLNYARAKSEYLKSKIQIESEFENDNDYQTYGERYKEKINKARGDASALIRNPMMRESFQFDTDVDIEQGLAGMAKKAFAKEKDNGRANLSGLLDDSQKLIVSTSDPAIRKSAYENVNQSVDAAIENNWLSKEEGVNLKRKFAEGSARAEFKSRSPKEQLQMLKDGHPAAKMLPPDELKQVEAQAVLAQEAAYWRGVRFQKHQQSVLADELQDRFIRTRDPASISLEEFQQLSPAGQESLVGFVTDTIKGIYRVTDMKKYSDLKMMAANPATREAFLGSDIEQEIATFNPKEQREIRNIYAKLLGDDPDEEKRLEGVWSLNQRIDNTLTSQKIRPKTDDEKARFAPIRNEIEREVMRKKGEVKRDLYPAEEQEIIDDVLIKQIVEVPGRVFGTNEEERYSFEVADEIPDSERQAIANALQESGIEPTTALIVRYYLKGKKAKDGK